MSIDRTEHKNINNFDMIITNIAVRYLLSYTIYYNYCS